MDILARNNRNVIVSDDLRVFTEVEADVSLVIYNLLLKQLHLATNDVVFSSDDKGKLLIEEIEYLEEFDALLMDQFDLSTVLVPNKLFSFYLLREWLGLSYTHDTMSLKHGKKYQVVFPCKSFSLLTELKNDFVLNELGRLLVKRIKRKDLLNTQANFFALINEKLEEKLFNAMVHFQSSTGVKVNKNAFLKPLFNEDRKKAFGQFIEKQIDKL